ERSNPVPVQGEPVVRAFVAADAGLSADLSFDREVNALTAPKSSGAGPLVLSGAPLPELETEAVTYRQQLARDGDASSLGAELARLTQSLRRYRDFTFATPSDQRLAWRRALALLEEFANGGDGLPLQREVVGALNRLQRAPLTKE